MISYESFTTQDCASTGTFDELIRGGASTMHPDNQELFRTTFSRLQLLDAYRRGETCVSAVTRQLGDDGVYRSAETADYFVKHPSAEDVLVITLCHVLK